MAAAPTARTAAAVSLSSVPEKSTRESGLSCSSILVMSPSTRVSAGRDACRQRPPARPGGAIWAYVIDQLHSYDLHVMTPELIEEAALRFALLGDPTRLRILNTLMVRGEMSVGAVAEASDTSRFNASAHLNRLAAGGFV